MKKKRKHCTTATHEAKPQLATVPAVSSGHVRLGDIVTRKPVTFSSGDEKTAQPMRGHVVYVHPAGRFHIVEFGDGAKKIRESFSGTER